ncbi:hypothetical protein [Qipengyuania citrea]|uniref:hypothetical protein n=1 Tax=Qipengyuania citrea TaxID=225971 RepID=UPI00209F9C45|nr:hypothetical protein [Qipengyuania citrea]
MAKQQVAKTAPRRQSLGVKLGVGKMYRLFAAATLLIAAPLSAQQTDEQQAAFDAAVLSDRELFAEAQANRWLEQPCDIGVPLFGEILERDFGDTHVARAQLFAGALCEDERDDYAAGMAKVRQLEAGWPDFDFTDLGLYFAVRSNNAAEYFSRMRALDNGQLGEFEPQRFWQGFRMVRDQGAEDRFDDIMLEWIDARRLAYLPADLHAGVAMAALSAAIRHGRAEMAPQLLATIRSPADYLTLLSMREYEAIWPFAAERAGPNLEAITDEYVFWASARLENHPSDRDRFSDAAHALHYAGRFEEAIALARQWRERDGSMASIEEGDGWALNIEAYANDALGRRDEADRIFDQLAALDPEEHPWVVNFVINRASRLVGHERWVDGLEAASLARRVADSWGSQYARMIIARDHTCALAALDRADEIAPELAFLRENKAESYTLAAQALLCVGERAEAVDLLLEGIADEPNRSQVLGGLQPSTFELFYTPSKLPHPVELLDESAELQAAFEQHARVIPEEFTPTASILANR